MQPAQKYPIGIQDFRVIREGGYAYVDKTAFIFEMVNSGAYYFLSRPRRFGKSLLISTMKALFEGQKELFEGLWIADKWDWSRTRPVLHLPFSSMAYQSLGLEAALHKTLDLSAAQYGLTQPDNFSAKEKLQDLILQLSAKMGKVVVLIDEYDKPLVEYLEQSDPETAERNRNVLRVFYSVVKDLDGHIEFFFMTGVSRFGMMSLFSELNNLQSITLHPRFDKLTGITQKEMEMYFGERLNEIAEEQGLTYEDLLVKVKNWYNGYSWSGQNRVYNPFSLLNFLSMGRFRNFWFATASPRLLIEAMRAEKMYDPSFIRVKESDLEAFDLRRINAIPLLFQTGYLTIAEDGDDGSGIFTLVFPNIEVKGALLDFLLRDIAGENTQISAVTVNDLEKKLRAGNLEAAIELLNAIFASLPYDHWPKAGQRGESFFHALFHIVFTLMGVYVQSEVHTARGRCDALVVFPDRVYAFEFKVDQPLERALEQLRERGYLEPYRASGKTLVGVGVVFSREERAIAEWGVASF